MHTSRSSQPFIVNLGSKWVSQGFESGLKFVLKAKARIKRVSRIHNSHKLLKHGSIVFAGDVRENLHRDFEFCRLKPRAYFLLHFRLIWALAKWSWVLECLAAGRRSKRRTTCPYRTPPRGAESRVQFERSVGEVGEDTYLVKGVRP